MSRWPRDNQAALIAFYGDPATGEVGRQLVKIRPPFKMYYDGRLLATLSFHAKAAPALLAALTKVWDYYGHDQAVIDRLGISKTAGTYNPRKVRGSATKWSNHAFGAAIDINAEENGFNVAGNIPPVMIAAFKSEGAAWGGDYKRRKDPMHFEFCDRGEPQRSFEQWLKVLGVSPRPLSTPAMLMEPDFAERPEQADEPDKVVEDFAEPEAVPAMVQPPPPSAETRGDPELWSIQRRLTDLKYNAGGLDGLWGSMTAGAITGFINDRHLTLTAPTSIEMFRQSQEDLKLELSRAESERFVRPVAPERMMATEATVARRAPELVPVKQSRLAALWAAISAGFAALVSAIGDYAKDAWEWISQMKTYLNGVPGWVWLGMFVGVCVFFYWKSREGAAGIVDSFKKGVRN